MIRLLLIFLLSTNLLAVRVAFQAPPEHSVTLNFAGAKGAAIVGFVYSMLAGISNFLWSFDWTRVGASSEQNKRIQEIGGLTASAENFLVGIFILWAYYYLKSHPSQGTDVQLDPVMAF